MQLRKETEMTKREALKVRNAAILEEKEAIARNIAAGNLPFTEDVKVIRELIEKCNAIIHMRECTCGSGNPSPADANGCVEGSSFCG
jgi:hypothetical protein